MNRPTLTEGIGVAIVLTLITAGVGFVLRTLFTAAFAAKACVVLAAAAYIVYLLARGRARAGRMILGLLSLGTLLGLSLAGPSLAAVIVVSGGLVWLVRSLAFYSSLVSSLVDCLLSGVAVAAALWAFFLSGSIAVALWCGFLVQALYALIPDRFAGRCRIRDGQKSGDRFQQAQRTAEAALTQLIERCP